MNTAPAESPSIVRPLTVPFIKLVTIAILVLIFWPVPAIVSHTSLENPVVFGRYTMKYFLLMTGYLSGVVVCAGLTGWCLWRLNSQRLAQMRRYIEEHLGLTLGVFALVTVGTVGIRSAILARLLSFPPVFADAMRTIPGLLYFMLLVLTSLIVDQRIVQQMESRLTKVWGMLQRSFPPNVALRRICAVLHVDLLVGFAVIAGSLLVFVVRERFWNYPLGLDPSVHIYLGRHILNGGVPYQTIIYFHPPLRFVVSLLWSLGANITGLPLIHFVRALDLGIAVGILAVTYGMGRELTGRPVGGLLAAAILLSTEHLNQLLIAGPTFRLTTVLFMVAGLWMAQRKRWLWASTLAALSALMWVPASVSIVAIVLSAFLQDEMSWWKAMLRSVLGVLLVIGVVGVSLALLGVLDDAYRQNIVSIQLLMARDRPLSQSSGSTTGFIESIAWYITIFKWVLRGEWELAALIVAGLLVTLTIHGVSRSIRSPKSSTLLFAAMLMLAATTLNFDGSMRDTVMLVSIATPFGAKTLIGLLTRLDSRLQHSSRHLQTVLEWAVLGMILVYGLSDTTDHQRFLYSLATTSLDKQQQMAGQLENALQPGETVQCVGSLWFLTLSGRDNATPFIQWGTFANSASEAAGWTFEEMVQVLERQRPVVVIVWPRPPSAEISGWLDSHYTFMGSMGGIDPVNRHPQQIFVRKGHDEIEAIIATWPLAGGN